VRRLKLFVATSLDGYIAARDGDVSWRFHEADYGYEAFIAGIDTVLLDRCMYETALSFSQWPYPDRKVVVFTRGDTLCVISPNTVATSRTPADIVPELRARQGKDLWLVGGGELVRECLVPD
jgi:dihydrofolate reductase